MEQCNTAFGKAGHRFYNYARVCMCGEATLDAQARIVLRQPVEDRVPNEPTLKRSDVIQDIAQHADPRD